MLIQVRKGRKKRVGGVQSAQAHARRRRDMLYSLMSRLG